MRIIFPYTSSKYNVYHHRIYFYKPETLGCENSFGILSELNFLGCSLSSSSCYKMLSKRVMLMVIINTDMMLCWGIHTNHIYYSYTVKREKLCYFIHILMKFTCDTRCMNREAIIYYFILSKLKQ